MSSYLGRNIYERLNQETSLKTDDKQYPALISTCFHAGFFAWRHVSPKRSLTSNGLHGVIS
jgi:hypothetical protein